MDLLRICEILLLDTGNISFEWIEYLDTVGFVYYEVKVKDLIFVLQEWPSTEFEWILSYRELNKKQYNDLDFLVFSPDGPPFKKAETFILEHLEELWIS